MDYLNFELRIGALNNELYPVTVIRSPAGETSAMVPFPPNDAVFKRRFSQIVKSRKYAKMQVSGNRFDDATRQLAPRDEIFTSLGEEKNAVKALGSDLFEKLFSGEIRSCFRVSLQKAREEKKGLRIHLRIEAPELAALPWEYLYDQVEGDFLCLSTETPLIRYLELAKPHKPLTVEPPLKILGVVASPKDLHGLDIDREKAQMNIAIEHLIDKGFIKLTWLEGQTWRDFQAAMRKGPWHILHFIGHGAFNIHTGEGAIALADDHGHTYQLAAGNLGRLLAGHHSMRLVILNSCEGARTSGTDLFSSAGASLIRKGIPAVISMQYEITDRAALEFSRTFYETIAEGAPVDAALQEARKAISLAIEGSSEWGTPVMHMRAPDGRLFDIDINSAIFPGAPQADEPASSGVPGTPSATTEAPPPGSEDYRGLKILANKVRQFWVTGVLEQSVQHSALIQLGLDNMPDVVDNPWGSIPVSSDQSIGEVFQKVGGSLLILGEPGAGKSIMLLTLARELLNQYENIPGLPLPVVFNLSSWTHSGKSLPAWLADELSTKYLIPRKIGEDWIENHRLLLLLDGLDEVRAGRRNECVSAINHFLQEIGVLGVVVCCRFREYIALNPKLNVNGAIRLQMLSREKIMNHVAAAGAPHMELYRLLQKDHSFLRLAETPFMLNLMMKTYQDKRVEQLIGAESRSIHARRRQLMDAYVNGQFQLVGKGSTKVKASQKLEVTRYSKTRARKWLSWMAKNMQQHDKTIFLIEELQVSWLPGKLERKAHEVISIILAGLIAGLIIGLSAGLIAGLRSGLILGLGVCLIIGLSGGLLSSINKINNVITTIESVRWSWKNLRKNYIASFKKGAIIGLFSGLVMGLIVGWLAGGLTLGLSAGLIFGLGAGLEGGLIGLLTSGWRGKIPQNAAIPNEGIKLTLRNSIKGILLGGLFGGLLGGLFGGLLGGLFGGLNGGLFGVLNGGLLGGLWLGGTYVIRHYTLRFFIYRRDYGPWNYANFLDYAVDELQFMQRVGGSYIFLHRMLLKYFAEMEVGKAPLKED